MAHDLMDEPRSAFEEAPQVRLACNKVWGGNSRVSAPIELPGLLGWLYSNPLAPSVIGGDIHHFSVCSQGVLSRLMLADVSGHGEAVAPVATRFQEAIRAYYERVGPDRPDAGVER